MTFLMEYTHCAKYLVDTFLFSKVYGIHKLASNRNDDLEKVSYWAYQWKMQFNPDPNKLSKNKFK